MINTNGFTINETCKVSIEWGDGSERNRRVQILNFQQNGNQIFAKVFWKGKNAKHNQDKFGTLFNVVTELVKLK